MVQEKMNEVLKIYESDEKLLEREIAGYI
jgi:hypothetical protein